MERAFTELAEFVSPFLKLKCDGLRRRESPERQGLGLRLEA